MRFVTLPRVLPLLTTALVASFALACSSEGTSNAGGSGGSGGGDGSGGTGGIPSGPGLDLPTPENGVQIRSVGTTIPPSEDQEFCEVVGLPGSPDEEFTIRRIEAQMTEFSHHLNIRAIVPGTEADRNSAVGDRVPCRNNGNDAFGEGFATLSLSQQRYENTEFPDGVGLTLNGGQKIVFNYHYLNTSAEPVEARAAVNLHFAEPGTVQKQVHRFGMYNFGIEIPARSLATSTMECRVNQDIRIWNLIRHTHRWGTDMNIWYAGGPRDGELIFTSTDWEANQDFKFDDPALIRAGEGFRFECNFDNTTDETLRFGVRADDEMCILYGQWFVNSDTEAALSQDCAGFVAGADGVIQGTPCEQCADGKLF